MKSIMQKKSSGYCYLCAKLNSDYAEKRFRQEHHCLHGKKILRSLSEKYGLKIYLCMQHHTYEGGPNAVHRNHDIDILVKQDAQKAFIKRFPDLDFIKIFGKNYLDEDFEEIEYLTVNENKKPGFWLIKDGD